MKLKFNDITFNNSDRSLTFNGVKPKDNQQNKLIKLIKVNIEYITLKNRKVDMKILLSFLHLKYNFLLFEKLK